MKLDDFVDTEKLFNRIHPEHREAVQQAINSMRMGKEAVVEYRIVPTRGTFVG